MTVVITGVAGFIGFHVAQALLAHHYRVIGVDNLVPYYDPTLKKGRLELLRRHKNFIFKEIDVSLAENVKAMDPYKKDVRFIIHLAAQPGVRYSMVNPYSYVTANVMGQLVMLEWARTLPGLLHFLYASSSSVYGLNTELPYEESNRVDQPASLYAATKRSAELVSSSYYHIYGLPLTGLRFFTVYGPWGRPDMAYYMFANCIREGKPITLYKGKNLSRDFTYIDDVVLAILSIVKKSEEKPAGFQPRAILNIGNHKREAVTDLVHLLETNLGKKAKINYKDRPVADMEYTFASIKAMEDDYGWSPTVGLSEGIASFVSWYIYFY
ncbi:NAD-dependent epimerase/dehydratase family protein [Entomobacter blattae]|uniref:NAD-dependent epimerase/dehydratase family protein n=1 Tax=Entomobacter blattae TaxID=2762277 RepID=UPI00193B3792|nr:NAD-dependent epimerase/dehydratase family protein [Entomobacter blattae]